MTLICYRSKFSKLHKEIAQVCLSLSVVLLSDHSDTEREEKTLRNVSRAGKTTVGPTHGVILRGVCPCG